MTAYVLRFIKGCRKGKTNDSTITLNAVELNHAEMCWIGCVQLQTFKECILKSNPSGSIRVKQFARGNTEVLRKDKKLITDTK